MSAFQEVCDSFCKRTEEFAYLWFLGKPAITCLFPEEEVLGNFYFPSGAQTRFSKHFMGSCAQPSVAQSGCCLSTYGLRFVAGVGWVECSAELRSSTSSWALGVGLAVWGQEREINGCSFGLSSPTSGFCKLSEGTCLTGSNSMALWDLRQTWFNCELFPPLVCKSAPSWNNSLVVAWLEYC